MKPRLIQNKAEKTAEILIYGPIGQSFWDDSGITAKDFTEALNEIPQGTKITVGINSQGGSIGEGLAIFNAIKRRAEDITARIDGYALSAGSFIPLAAGKVVSPESSIWMIHKGWTVAQGNAEEFRKQAEVLDAHDETLVDIYAGKTGIDKKTMAAALSDETWLTGTEAVEWGLADEAGGDVSADAMAIVDLSKAPQGAFKHTPALALLKLHRRLLHDRLASGEPVTDFEAIGTVPVAACEQNNEGDIRMDKTQETPAQAAKEQPVDFTPVIDAINGLADKLDKPVAAADPIAPRVENLGNPAIEKLNSMQFDAVGKGRFVRENYLDVHKAFCESKNIKAASWNDRFDYRNPDVMAANTIDSNLANTILASDAVTVLRTLIAPLQAFAKTVSLSPVSKRQTLYVPRVSSSGSVQSNATNYETGDTTWDDIGVTVSEISKSWTSSRPEQNLGLLLAQGGPTNAAILGEGIMALITAKMVAGDGSTTGFGAATAIGTAANFDSADLRAVLALGKNYSRCTLLLDGGHLAYLLPTTRESFAFGEPGAYGFDGGIYKNNLWTGATSNACGFIASPDAICIGMGMPADLPAGEAISVQSVNVVGDISVQSSVWFSRASRSLWGCYAVMFGVAVGDGTAGEVLVTS